MVAGKSPEKLPPGWKEHIKVSGGRKIKYYTSAETDKKFYSKKGVISYTSMKNDSNSTPQPETTSIGKKGSGIGSKADAHTSMKKDSNSTTPQLETTSLGKEGSGTGSKADAHKMETNESLAWLPQGWMIEVKARKGGLQNSNYKIYIDPSTGSKFYSKPEVLRYLESLDQSKNKDQMTNDNAVDKSPSKKGVTEHQKLRKGPSRAVKNEKNSSNKPSSEIVCPDVIESSCVDELSVGWIADFRTRKCTHGIEIDAYYTDPVSGYVFRSEKDVFSYLETGHISKCAMKPKKKVDGDSKSTKDVNLDNIMEKTPLKNDVLEHHALTNVQGSISNKKKNIVSQHSTNVVETASMDGLPPGWIKEIKTTKNAHGIRKDPFYIDPVSGYMFRSKKDALRYLETGDINKCAMKPKKRDVNDPEPTKDVSSPSTPVDKRYSLRSSRGQLSTDEKLTDGKEICDMTPVPNADISERKKVGVLFTESVTEVTGKSQLNRRGRKSRKTAPSSALESEGFKQDSIVPADVGAVSIAGTPNLPGQELPRNRRKQKTSRKTAMGSRKSEKTSGSTPTESKKSIKRASPSLPGRTSKRLAGFQPEMPANLELSERSLRAAIKKSSETEVDILSIITMNGGAANGASQPLDSELAPENAVTKSNAVEPDIPPVTNISTITERIPQHPLDPEPTAGVADIVSMVVESISKIEESEKSEETRAVPERKTGRKVNEKQESANPNTRTPQGTYPFLDSWPDPCLDFAFKTLTGALPVDNNKVAYQGSSENRTATTTYYQNQTETSSFQNGRPSFSLNSVEQHTRVEQSPRSPTSIPPGFGLPIFGGNGSQQRREEDQASIPPGFGSPSFGGMNSQRQHSTEARPSIPPGFGLPFFGGFGSQPRSSETRNDSQRKY